MADRVRRTQKMRDTLAADKERAAAGQADRTTPWPVNVESRQTKAG